MKKSFCLVLSALILLPCGCGMKKMATNVIAKISTDGMVALEDEQDIEFARETAPSLIKTLEVLSYGNPKDGRALALLSQSYGQFTFGFIENEILAHRANETELAKDKSRAALFYKRGKDFGMKAISQSMGAKASAPFPEFKKALGKLGKKDTPALFWTAFNWALYLNLNLADPSAIAELPRIQAMIDRVNELDPDFYYGTAHAFKGVIAAMRPKMLGGDTALSETEFKKAMEIAPTYLMTKVLYAQYYARQIQDAGLFKKTLLDVSEADATALPGQKLANGLAIRRAKLLLSMEKTLF